MTSLVNSNRFGNGGVNNVGGNFDATGADYLRIWVYAEGAVSVTSVVFGAQTLTLISGSTFGNWLGCYELVAPAQSIQDARFTLNASSGRLLAYVSAWSGVNQSTPSRTPPTGATGNSAAPTITVLGNAGDVAEAVCMMANAAFTFDTSLGGVEIQHADNWVSTFRSLSAAFDVTEDSPFNWTAGAAANYWAVGIPIIASGGAGAPSITNVDTDNTVTSTQTGWVVNGTGFNTATVSITQGSTTKSQTVTGQTATTITCNTVFDTGGTPHLKYGAATLRVTNADTQFGNQAITLIVPSGRLAVDITVPNGTAGNRITAVPDIAAGDQLEVSNVVGGTIADVNVNADATFDCGESVISFDVRCWSTADSTWGSIGTQVVSGGQTGGTGVVGSGVVGPGVVGPLGVSN